MPVGNTKSEWESMSSSLQIQLLALERLQFNSSPNIGGIVIRYINVFFGNAFATTIRSIIAWIAIRSSRVSKCSLNWKWIIMRQYICWTFNYTASYWDVRAQVYARQINRYSMKIKLQQMVYLVLWKARRATVGKVDGPRNWVMSNGKATGIFCKELRQSLKIL